MQKVIISENLNLLLNRYKKSVNLRQLLASSQLNVDYSYVQMIRNGKANVSIEKLEAIVSAVQPFVPWLKPWMLLVPNYIALYDYDVLSEQGQKSKFELIVNTAVKLGILETDQQAMQLKMLCSLAYSD